MPRKVFFFHPGAPRPASSTDGALLFYVFPSLFSSLSFFSFFSSPSFAAGPSAAVCKPARPPSSPTSSRCLFSGTRRNFDYNLAATFPR